MFFLIKIILLLCIILHSCFQASSLWCYRCLSPTVPGYSCYNNPNQRKFERDCDKPIKMFDDPQNGINKTFADINDIFHNRLLSTNKSRQVDERLRGYHQCVKFKAYILYGIPVVLRGCTSSLLTDEDIVRVAKEVGMTEVNSIERCDSDLCNSSRDSSAAIGKVFLSLISSLILILSHQL